jgi:hypothetical protein
VKRILDVVTPEEWGRLIVAAQGLVRADVEERAALVAGELHLANAWHMQLVENAEAIIAVGQDLTVRRLEAAIDAVDTWHKEAANA